MVRLAEVKTSEISPQQTNLDRLWTILNTHLPTHYLMERLVVIVRKYSVMLYEPALLFRFRSDWVAFLNAIKLLNTYKTLKPTDIQGLGMQMQAIRMYDKKLAQDIAELVPYDGKDEASFLVRWRHEIESWPRYDDTYSINYFIKRLGLFLYGGEDKNEKSPGLLRDFKDEKLMAKLLKDPAVRNLLFYEDQVVFLKYLIELCKRSEKSGEWEGFYGKKGFWTKFKKYAKSFETKFGNIQIKEYLLANRKHIGESPWIWGGQWEKRKVIDPNEPTKVIVSDVLVDDGELPKLLRELQDFVHQRQKIVIPAALSLVGLFQNREKELKAKFLSKFIKLLKRRRKAMMGALERDMAELMSQIADVFLEYDAFVKYMESAMSKIEPKFVAERTGKLSLVSREHLLYALQQIKSGRFLSDIKNLASADISDRIAKEALRQKARLERFEHLTDEDFNTLEMSKQRAQEIIRKLKTIYLYIQSKMDMGYVIKVENLERLETVKIKNTDFSLIYVRRMINRLLLKEVK